jgi:hypothetical protein
MGATSCENAAEWIFAVILGAVFPPATRFFLPTFFFAFFAIARLPSGSRGPLDDVYFTAGTSSGSRSSHRS